MKPKNTGYKPENDLKEDNRDIQYGSIETVDFGAIPETYLPDNPIPDYQGNRPFCVLHSVSYAMRLLYDKDYSEPFLAAIAEWKESGMPKPGEHYTITYGTSIKYGLWAAQHYGACKESLYPPNNKDWKWLSDKNNIPPEAFNDAQANKIGLYSRIGQADWGNLSADEIMDAIYKWKGVIIGMRGWYKGWYQKYSQPTQEGNTWYHAIILDGIVSKSNRIVRFKNWWDGTNKNVGNGRAWGYMELDKWLSHIAGAFVITKYDKPMKITESQLVKLYQTVFHRQPDPAATGFVGQELEFVLDEFLKSEEFQHYDKVHRVVKEQIEQWARTS